MTPPITAPLLMGCSLEALRGKLLDSQSPLAPWWRHFLTLARQDPVRFSPYTVLAALVTGEDGDRELARQAFLRYLALRAEGEISHETQFHTHVVSAPLGRWAIFYDWLADHHLFSDSEDAAIRDFLLDYTHIFALQHLQSRRLAFDNQMLANAFGSAAVGYVLGIRRGDSALARRLFVSGIHWLQALLGRLPVGGYSPEGSTYHEQVVMPLTLLAARLVEEATGSPVMMEGLPPTYRPVRELLATSFKMIGPGGLLPAWDDYGYQAATVKCGLAYLARLTRDPQPLAVVRAGNMWYRAAHPAWELDDRLWTLVWWPTEIDAPAGGAFMPWMVSEVGGALQEPSRKLRLFQYWDECGGVPSSGRAQVDPNAITLEAFDSPILLDGRWRNCDFIPFPERPIADYIGQRTIQTVKEYARSAWGAEFTQAEAIHSAMAGAIGFANSVVLDGETWYVPLAPRVGRGQALQRAGPLQVLRSDATNYYTDRYDVCRVARTSLLVGGKYVLVSDRIVAKTPHTVTWQAFLRPDAISAAGRITVRTAEQVQCDIVPLQAGTLELTPVDGYPLGPSEGRSLRLCHTVAPGTDTRVDMALIPQCCLKLVCDLTEDWEREINGRRDGVSVATAYLTDPATDQASPRVFRRQVAVAHDAHCRYFLRVGIASRLLEVAVNGRVVAPTTTQPQGIWSESSTDLPWFFDVSGALRDGANGIELRAPFFHGETIAGSVQLWVEQNPLKAGIVRVGPDAFKATVGDETDYIILEREGRVQSFAGGETNARYALLAADGSVAACDVTFLRIPGGPRVRSSALCDLHWTREATTLSRWMEGSTLQIAWDDGSLDAEMKGCIQATYHGTAKHRFIVDAPLSRMAVVNGTVVGCRGGSEPHRVILDLAGEKDATIAAPTTPEQVYALAERAGAAAEAAFIGVLQGNDWRVQLAAADVVGQLGIAAAAAILLQLFAEAEKELPYPPLRKRWRTSKMLRGNSREEGPDPTVPLPIGVKRWRVKRAVVTALGKLGDLRAVAPFEAALQRCDDFFPVLSQLAVALGRLGSSSSIPVLERHCQHAEVNLRMHARLSLALLKREIDRNAFEEQVGERQPGT